MPAISRLRASRHSLVLGGLVGVSHIAQKMSLPRARALGRRLGAAAYAVLKRNRTTTLANLAIAFPELGAEEHEAIAREAFRHFGESLLEISWMPNLTRENYLDYTEIVGLENLQKAVDARRGVVLFTGHCGNWEWMAAVIALAGFDMNVVARDQPNSRVNDFIVSSRARYGIKSIGRGTGSAAREILQTLRNGSILGVLIDQNIKAESARVPFFGRPALTPTGPAKLAIRAGAMAIAGFIERRNGKQIVTFHPPIETTREMTEVELTATMTKAIEEQIRRVPEQWVWVHKRWRERKGY